MVVTTTAFRALTERAAAMFDVADARIVVIDHPLGGILAPAVLERAAAIVDEVEKLWQQ